MTSLAEFLRRHGFLICLALFLALGAALNRPVAWISDLYGLRSGMVAFILFLLGWTLPLENFQRSFRHPGPALVAVAVNMVLVPVIAAAVFVVIPHHWWARGDAQGLLVASLVPSTMASATIWVRRAGGDESITMITTVLTNIFCVVVVPLALAAYRSLEWFPQDAFVSAPIRQVWRLGLYVVLPLILGQALRGFGTASLADRCKGGVKQVSQFGILSMAAFGAAKASIARAQESAGGDVLAGSQVFGVGVTAWVVCVAAVVAVHVATLRIGIMVSRRFGHTPEQQIAVGIGGSQKTLMVGLQIAMDCGVSVLPMVLYHAVQLLWDARVVDRWRGHDRDRRSKSVVPIDRAGKVG